MLRDKGFAKKKKKIWKKYNFFGRNKVYLGRNRDFVERKNFNQQKKNKNKNIYIYIYIFVDKRFSQVMPKSKWVG